MKAKIKLLYCGECIPNVIRLQSQLYVGRDAADYILEDGVLKVWKSINGKLDFYPVEIKLEINYNKKNKDMETQYEIVYNKKDMETQII